MLTSLPTLSLRLRHLQSHGVFVQLKSYWEAKGKKQDDKECEYCDMIRGSAEILEQKHVVSLTLFQEYQQYCAMTSIVHSMITWDNNHLLKCIIENHPNIWKIDAADDSNYQSTRVYNDIFSSLYNSFAMLFNTGCAQSSTDIESFISSLPHRRAILKRIIEISDLIRQAFAYYLYNEQFPIDLSDCLHENAFHILFSLVDLFMTEFLLLIYIANNEKGNVLDIQLFMSVVSLYTEISISLQEKLTNMNNKDCIFTEIQRHLSFKVPLLLTHFYCTSAKAAAVSQDLKLARIYINRADIFLSQCSINNNESTVNTLDPNQGYSLEKIRAIIQYLQGDIYHVIETCGTDELTYMFPIPPSTIDYVREALLTNDIDYETFEAYQLYLSWNYENNTFTFTAPIKDSTKSFDAALDDIDIDDIHSDSEHVSTQRDLASASACSLDSESDNTSIVDKQNQLSSQDTEEKSVDNPTLGTHHSEQSSSQSSQPSMVHMNHASPINSLSTKGEGFIDIVEAPSVELPTLSIEKPSKVPTPTFTSSLVERVASGDQHIDYAYDTKVPTLEGHLPPRHILISINAEYSRDPEEHVVPLPVDLLSGNIPELPFDYTNTIETGTQDVLPVSIQHLVDLSHSSTNVPSSEKQLKTDLQSASPQIQDHYTENSALGGVDIDSQDLYVGMIPDAIDTRQDDLLFRDRLPSTSHLSEDDDIDNMTANDLICSHGVHDTPEHDSVEAKDVEDDGDRQTTLLDEIALEMRQSAQSDCSIEESSKIGEPVQDTEKELDIIVTEMNIAQSDDSLKISSNTSLHSSGNEITISRLSPELAKHNSVIALSAQLNTSAPAAPIDVNAAIAEKINPEEAMNVAAPVFMANMCSTSMGHMANLVENALSYCEEVSLHQSVNSSTVNNIVLSVGSGTVFSASTESIKKFLADSQTSLGMSRSISLSHSYIDKARIRRKARLLQSRAERIILITLLIVFVILIVCTL